jgi:hypothetical protein
MERDQVLCFVWPVCPVHHFGGHANVLAERAGVDTKAIWITPLFGVPP